MQTNTYDGDTTINGGTVQVGGGVQEWYDAADAGTVLVSGGTIYQWNDKSGHGRNLTQGTAANQPTLAAGVLNGLPVVRFDGNDVIAQTTYDPGNPYTIVSVARYYEGTAE